MALRVIPILALALSCAAPAAAPSSGRAPERVLFDTDVGGDIDDAGALAVLHGLADRGEIEILAIGVVNGHENAVPYVDALNTWYGRPNLPVGTVKSGAPFSRDKYMARMVQAFPHALTRESAPDAADLYRKILSAQPDGSVTLIAVGPATNVSRLLEAPDGRELVRRKVKFYAAGGNGDGGLPRGRCGWNYRMDRAAARNELEKLPEEFPTVFAGGSGPRLKIGNCLKSAPENHFIRLSYEAYFEGKPDLDRPSWDQLRLLYGGRPSSRALFETSPPGDIRLGDKDAFSWSAEPRRNRSYAYVKDFEEVRREIEVLMSRSPGRAR
jgi:hypothetical protein